MSQINSLTSLSSLALAVFIGGCGFKPMYGTLQDDATNSQLRQVKVDVIANRPGQVLRNYLLDTMTEESSDANKYLLKIKLSETKNKLGIRRDETSSYMQTVVTAAVELINLATGKVDYTDSITQVASIPLGSSNRAESYSADVAQEASRDKALKLIADDISLHIAAYLSGKDESR